MDTIYRLSYTVGNGYHCGCCRRSDTYTEDFDTVEEIAAFIAKQEFEPNGNKADFSADEVSIVQVSTDDILQRVYASDTYKDLKAAAAQKRQDKQAKKSRKEEEQAQARAKAEYERLKAQFEGK